MLRAGKRRRLRRLFHFRRPGILVRPQSPRYNLPIPISGLPVRSLALTLKILMFLLLLGFAAKNSEFVALRYFLGLEWQVPLSLVLLISFAAGLMVGLLACSSRLLRNYRELREYRRSARQE